MSGHEKKFFGTWKLTLILAVLTVIIFFFAFNPFYVGIDYPDSETIKIASLMPYTGVDSADIGKEYIIGMEIALDELNKDRSQKFELVKYDIGNESTSLLLKFFEIYESGIPIVIGPIRSSDVTMIAPYAEIQKVVVLSPAATSEELSVYDSYVFRIVPSDKYLGIGAAKLGQYEDTAVIYDPSSSYCLGILDAMKEEANELGINEKFHYIPNNNPKETASQILNLSTVSIFAFLESIDDLKEVMRAVKDVGVMGYWTVTDTAYVSEMADVADCAVEIYSLVPARRLSDLYYMNLYEQKTSHPMTTTTSIYGYDAMMLVGNLILSYGYDRDILSENLKKWRTTGLTGAISFDKYADRYPSYDVAKWTDNGWKIVNWDDVIKFSNPEAENNEE